MGDGEGTQRALGSSQRAHVIDQPGASESRCGASFAPLAASSNHLSSPCLAPRHLAACCRLTPSPQRAVPAPAFALAAALASTARVLFVTRDLLAPRPPRPARPCHARPRRAVHSPRRARAGPCAPLPGLLRAPSPALLPRRTPSLPRALVARPRFSPCTLSSSPHDCLCRAYPPRRARPAYCAHPPRRACALAVGRFLAQPPPLRLSRVRCRPTYTRHWRLARIRLATQPGSQRAASRVCRGCVA
jgi:hypothetical protein